MAAVYLPLAVAEQRLAEHAHAQEVERLFASDDIVSSEVFDDRLQVRVISRVGRGRQR
jgi:hypothetical protein